MKDFMAKHFFVTSVQQGKFICSRIKKKARAGLHHSKLFFFFKVDSGLLEDERGGGRVSRANTGLSISRLDS